MELSRNITNKTHLKVSVNQSIHLQQHLRFLTLPLHELEVMALELLETNPAIESFEPFTGLSSSLDLIPQPKMEAFFEQIPTQLLSSIHKILAEEIFESLNSEGFLYPEEKKNLMDKHGSLVGDILHLIQTCSGLGFENRLFYWQHLLEKTNSHSACIDLLTRYPNELKEGDFPALLKNLKISFAEFKTKYLNVLKTLPWAPLSPLPTKVYTQKVDAEVRLSESFTEIDIPSPLPTFYLSKLTLDSSPEVKEFYKPHIEALKAFIDGVKKRKLTLEKLLNKLIVLQKDYFLGERSTPLNIHPEALASELDIHPSTLARCLQNKTILCVHGVIALKSLVNPAYINEDKKSLLEKLKSLILNEDKNTPYSDEKLLQLLKAKGSKISRRTLTKYRHQLKIKDARARFFS